MLSSSASFLVLRLVLPQKPVRLCAAPGLTLQLPSVGEVMTDGLELCGQRSRDVT